MSVRKLRNSKCFEILVVGFDSSSVVNDDPSISSFLC